MDKTALDVIRVALRADGIDDDEDATSMSGTVVAALGANGYVVVPRHLLDELLAAGETVRLDLYTSAYTIQRLKNARAAVVEAVGPTREDQP